MARINAISEGQPLTYDLINEIINQVNEVKEIPDDFGDAVEVYGPDLGKSQQDSVSIVTGSYKFNIGKNEISKDVEIKFNTKKNNGKIFNKDSVIVTASVVDVEIGKNNGGIQMATLTITKITKTGFNARVQILKESDSQTTLKIHYIAIGASPKNN